MNFLRRFSGALLVGLGMSASGLRAQEEFKTLSLDRLSAWVSGYYHGSWSQFRGSPSTTDSRRETVDLGLQGSFFHPNIAAFEIAASPSFIQDRQQHGPDDAVDFGVNGDRLDGRFRLTLFQGFPIQGVLHGSKGLLHESLRAGGSREIEQTEWGAELRDVNPLMPATLTYLSRGEAGNLSTGLPGGLTRQNVWTGLLRYQAQSSKTLVLLERLVLRQGWTTPGNATAQDLRFLQRQAGITHRLPWGTGSVLSSRIHYHDRSTAVRQDSPASLIRTFRWSENASLHQSSKVRSNLAANWLRRSSAGSVGHSLHGAYGLSYRPARQVGLSVLSNAMTSRFGEVSRSQYDVGPRTQLTFLLPRGSRFGLDLDARYRWNRQGSDGQVLAEVLQERHRPGPGGVFVLRQLFVVASTVVVFNETGDRLYEEDFDYRVVVNGPQLEIHLLAGTRIPEDEDVLVDYSYEIVTGAENEELKVGFNTSLRMGPLAVGGRGESIRVMSGQEGPQSRLPGIRARREAWVSFSQPLGRVSLSIGGTRGRWSGADTLRADFQSATFQVGMTVASGLSLTSSGTYRRTTGTGSDYLSRRFMQMLRWQLSPSLRVSGSASYWSFVQDGAREVFAGAGGTMEVGRRSRKLKLRYDFRERQEDGFSGHRLWVEFSQALRGF